MYYFFPHSLPIQKQLLEKENQKETKDLNL